MTQQALRRVAQLSIAVVACSAPVSASFAQNLVDSYRLALASDPKYRAAMYSTLAARTSTDQAMAGFLPDARLDFDSSKTHQRIISSENPIFGAGVTDFPTKVRTFTITQPIFRREAIDRYSQSKAVVKQANFTLLAASQDLILRTASAYLLVLAASDAVEFAAAEREAVGRALELAQERLKMGLGTITARHEATARLALSKAREIESRNKLSDATQGLREIIGQMPVSMQTLRADFPLLTPDPPDVEQWVAQARQQNLSLQARAAAVEVAQADVDRQKAAHYPSLNLVLSQNRRDAGSTLFGGGSNVDTREVAFRLNVPIYSGGLISAVTKEAVFKYQKAQEESEQESRALERQTRAAFDGSISGAGLVQALAQSVAAQQAALDGKESGLKAGINTMLPVLDAQRDLFAAKRDFAQARYEYLINRLKLEQAAGSLSETHLQAVSAALQ